MLPVADTLVFVVLTSDVAEPEKKYVWPDVPVIVYVHMNVPLWPAPRDAMLAGVGPEEKVFVAVPPVESAAVTFPSADVPLFVTVIVTVTS